MKFNHITIISLFLLFFTGQSATAAAPQGRERILSGRTMGTFYTIKFISNKNVSLATWKKKVDTRLREINKKLSMYDPKSELSFFNRHEIETAVTLSPDFFSILLTAKNLFELTNGAWDGTVKPLVDLWGFGTKKKMDRVPEENCIKTALSSTGFHHIVFKPDRTIQKKAPITLDLGSIAKGYGVDAIASLFAASGIHNVLVEIGGELYASGKNKKGRDWSVGINRPDKRFTGQTIYKIVRLKNQAIATSGNYRNFFELKGKTFSHIISPTTGYPVSNNIVSASVISGDCTFADGLATALMVMDVKKGLDLVNRLENTECLILQKKNQDLISHASKNFEAVVAIPSP